MFRFISVDIGPRAMNIPVLDLVGTQPGKTLLVTAGMDGDEYASIEAAYRVADEFSSRAFSGRLVVVPIVNMMGFWNECSQNPVDGVFPKMRLIGRPHGTSTERLMHWLSSTYALRADCWYDAHGGAITERLNPFLWVWRARRTASTVDAIRTLQLAERFVEERVRMGSGAGVLGRAGCAYVIGESGERGRRDDEDVARHTAWIHGIMHALGMIDDPSPLVAQTVYRSVRYVMAPTEGIWRPVVGTNLVARGDVLGDCVGLDGRLVRTVTAPASGVRLWWKETMALRSGDILCVIAQK